MQDPLRDAIKDSIKASGNYAADAPAFGIYVPSGVAGCAVQVEAPDGVVLEINLPDNVREGDMISFEKSDDGQWIPLLTCAPEPMATSESLLPRESWTRDCNEAMQGGAMTAMSAMGTETGGTEVDNGYQFVDDGFQQLVNRIDEVACTSREDVLAMAQRLEEHQVRYVEEQDAILARIETVEQFLHQMAPALQGLLDRFEGEEGARANEGQKIGELVKGLEAEFSKQSELTQARVSNQEEALARLEAEITRLQENANSTAKQLAPLAVAADNKDAEAQAVDRLVKLVENERSQTNERYIALEARLDAVSMASAEKVKALETRVEVATNIIEQQEVRLSQDLQQVSANVQQQEAGLEAVSAAVQLQQASGGGHVIESDIVKRFEEEQVRNLESMKKLDLLFKESKEEVSRLSEESTLMRSEVDMVKRTCKTNADVTNIQSGRIEAAETRLLALDRLEREYRNTALENLVSTQRIERIEAAVEKVGSHAPNISEAMEAVQAVVKNQKRLTTDSQAMMGRIGQAEAGINKAMGVVVNTEVILARLASVEATMAKATPSPVASVGTTGVIERQASIKSQITKNTELNRVGRLTRAVEGAHEALKIPYELLQRLGQPPPCVPAKVLAGGVQAEAQVPHSRSQAPLATAVFGGSVTLDAGAAVSPARRRSVTPTRSVSTPGFMIEAKESMVPPAMSHRSVTPPRSPALAPRIVEPSVSIMMEPQEALVAPLGANGGTTPRQRSITPRRHSTPPRGMAPQVTSAPQIASAPQISSFVAGSSVSVSGGCASPQMMVPQITSGNRTPAPPSPRSEPLFAQKPGSVRGLNVQGGSVSIGQESPVVVGGGSLRGLSVQGSPANTAQAAGMQAEPLFTVGVPTAVQSLPNPVLQDRMWSSGPTESTVSGSRVPMTGTPKSGGYGWFG